MTSIGRNEPCPCGSGAKFKKCCLDRKAQANSGPRVVERKGERLIASKGVTDDELTAAAAHFAQKRRGRGPAQDLAEFAEPLMEGAEGPDGLQKALTLGSFFWNLALAKDDSVREEMIEEMVKSTEHSPEEARAFRSAAAKMVERHRKMFPQLHG